MSLGSNGVNRAHSMQKILTRRCGTNFCVNMVHRVSCSDETMPNAPKHYKMHENLSFGSNGADKLRSFRKFLRDFVAQTFSLIAPTSSAPFAPSLGQ